MSVDKVQLLKRRAQRFLYNAKNDYKEKFYDLSAFHVEQALQLYIKAVIFELFGKEYRGHGIRELLGYSSKLLRENEYENLSRKVSEIIAEFREQLIHIEDSYITSRYEIIEYNSEDIKSLIETAEKLIGFLEEVVKSVKLG
jgi:HEPN domain-containing protein